MPPRVLSLSLLLSACLLPGAVGLITPAGAQESRSRPRTRDIDRDESPLPTPATLTFAVSDFSGRDRTLARDLTFALLTELDAAEHLPVIERSRYQRALRDLDLPTDADLTSPEVRRLARRIDADRLLTGTFTTDGDDLTVRARLLSADTGRAISGGSFTVSGDVRDLAEIAHRLARQINRRVSDLNDEPLPRDSQIDRDATYQRGEADAGTAAETARLRPEDTPRDLPSSSPDWTTRSESDAVAWERLQARALIPARVRPNTPLTERDLTGLVRRLGFELVSLPSGSERVIGDSPAPVTRLRALAALAKLNVAPRDLQAYRSTTADSLTPDADTTPQWGLPFLAAAIEQGWWRADRAIHAREIATWAFARTLIARMPLRDFHDDWNVTPRPTRRVPIPQPVEPVRIEPPHVTRIEEDDAVEDNDKYTGLVIDARDYTVKRSMSPRILDEDGNPVYPDTKHLPGLDYIEDHGIAEYFHSVEEAKRAGDHPLVIRALNSVSESGHDDLIISNAAAARIRAANKRRDFLSNWNVAILINHD